MYNQEKLYWSRLKMVFGFFLVFLGILLVVLFYRQIIKHGYYVALANSEHFVAQQLPAHRGKIYASSIYDQTPFLLAGNQELYSLNLVPQQISDKAGAAQTLAPLAGMNQADIFGLINNSKAYIPAVKDGLSYDQAQEILKQGLDGVYLVPEDRRFYPQQNLMGQILGYVDYNGQGNYGVEQYYNKDLSGDSGSLTAEKDVFGNYIDVNQQTNPQNGKDLYLTIEVPVQQKAEEIIQQADKTYGSSSGQIIIMNPQTGAIIAEANDPSYNPENYAAEAQAKGVGIFTNPVTSELYEPGSTLKSIAMAVALENKAVTPDKVIDTGASIQIQGSTIWTSDKLDHGNLNMAQILEWSDNVGIVKVEQMVGKDAFYKFLLQHFRFNQPTGIDLPSEASWQPGSAEPQDIDVATMAFGQGIALTPLQVLSAYSAIANKGVEMRPYVVAKEVDANGKAQVTQPQQIAQIFSSDTAGKLTSMLQQVAQTNLYKTSINIPNYDAYKIAGKTGTAQVPSPNGGYMPNTTIQSFAGFFPADNPQFVVLVKLDYPNSQWADYSAAPTFGQIAQFLINYYQIAPE
jgi:cell division protein FtsI/penicillin-binding protein 2